MPQNEYIKKASKNTEKDSMKMKKKEKKKLVKFILHQKKQKNYED